MKDIKVDFSPEMFQQVGRVPVFNDKSTATLNVIITIPFAKALEKHTLYGSEEQLRDADPVVIKRLCRGEPMTVTVKHMMRQMIRRKYEG